MQPDGTQQSYSDVSIKILHNALYLTTANGKGTLVINRAACSYQGEILVCLPTGVTLVQGGNATPLNLTTGTVYLNLTKETQPLALSSAQLPPRSLMMSFSTKRGTFVGLTGQIDEVVK